MSNKTTLKPEYFLKIFYCSDKNSTSQMRNVLFSNLTNPKTGRLLIVLFLVKGLFGLFPAGFQALEGDCRNILEIIGLVISFFILEGDNR